MKISENRKNGHIQILIADEPPIYGNGLRALLENEPDFNVVGIASNQTATLRMSQERKPDVLLLNVRMTANDGMDVLDRLQTLNIPVRPLLLATSVSGPQLMRALLLGARGVVLKKSSAQMLFDGIRGVMIGQYWIGAEVGTSMMEGLRQYRRSGGGTTKKGAFGLTPRELDIVSTVVGGYSNAEIAQKYKLSEQTVKHHLSSIFDKVGVYNRLELALFAVNHRLIENDAG